MAGRQGIVQEWAAILGRDKVGSHGKVRKPGIQLRDFGRAGGGLVPIEGQI